MLRKCIQRAASLLRIVAGGRICWCVIRVGLPMQRGREHMAMATVSELVVSMRAFGRALNICGIVDIKSRDEQVRGTIFAYNRLKAGGKVKQQ